MSKIPFTKMHGCGNDYIYVNTMLYDIPNPSAASILWSDRHKGIGSDGLVLIGRSPIPEADFSMRIFNADGSEAMMCGNASRCIGKYLYEKGLTPNPKPHPLTPSPKGEGEAFGGDGNGYQETRIRLLTKSGIKTLFLHINNDVVESVTVDMGEPAFEDDSLFKPQPHPLTPSPKGEGEAFGGGSALFVSMGNPHYVIFTDDIDQVGETGPLLEHHTAFPQRSNIEFAAPQLGESLGGAAVLPLQSEGGGERLSFRVRVWERGSGITQACGTGACAVAVAAARLGHAGRKSTIIMDGGSLDIEWRESDNHVYMTGPAEFVFEGEVELSDVIT